MPVREAIVNSSKVLLLVCLLLPCGTAWAASDFTAPPNAKLEWVTPDATTEGMQLRIRKFTAISMSVDDVLKFYREEWVDEFAEVDMSPWKMIGTKQGKEYWNVQVQAGASGGSWGYLGVSDLPEILEKGRTLGGKKGKGFPKMAGSTVINDNQYKDIGKQSRTVLLQNKFSVASNVSYYRNHYINNGWNAVMDRPSQLNGGHVLYLSKGSESLGMTFTRSDRKTSVVANEVKHGY